MESFGRRLSFDSSNDDYESCASSGERNDHRSESAASSQSQNNDVLNFNSSRYSFIEMREDMLGPDSLFLTEIEDLVKEIDEDGYDVLPQKLEEFCKVTDSEKTKTTFEDDGATKEISEDMETEHQMILHRIRKTLSIPDDKLPSLDDLVNYFYGPTSRITSIFL